MYGQMTAGSWIYIGTQGILQGTYETFAAVAAKRFGGTLAGTLTLTGGCGGMGGAQPLAVTLNERRLPDRRRRRVAAAAPGRAPLPGRGRRPTSTTRSPAALRGQGRAPGARRSAWSATAPTVLPELLRRGVDVDIVTDQTSRARPAGLPARGRRPRRLARLRRAQARGVHRPGAGLDGQARRGHGRLPWTPAPRSSTTATRSATRPGTGGYDRAFDFPGFVPAYIRPLFCEGKGPFRWAALSGDPKDIAATDRAVLDLFPDNDHLHRWIRAAAGAGRVPGPAGADLLARLRRAGQGRPARSTSWSPPASCRRRS